MNNEVSNIFNKDELEESKLRKSKINIKRITENKECYFIAYLDSISNENIYIHYHGSGTIYKLSTFSLGIRLALDLLLGVFKDNININNAFIPYTYCKGKDYGMENTITITSTGHDVEIYINISRFKIIGRLYNEVQTVAFKVYKKCGDV